MSEVARHVRDAFRETHDEGVDAFLEALARRGLEIRERVTRDTDHDELRPTLAPEEVCPDCGAPLDEEDGACQRRCFEP